MKAMEKAIYDLFIWPKKKLPDYNPEKHGGAELMSIQSDSTPTEKISFIIIKAENPRPGNPIVVVGHGNGEMLLDYATYFLDTFIPNGISYCVIDYRGYGYSDGKQGTCCVTEPEDVITVINHLKTIGYQKISYFGRSLGATCGIFVAAEFPDLVCVALDSPWLSSREWIKYQSSYLRNIDNETFDKLLPSLYKNIKERTVLDFYKITEPRNIASKITQPFFLIHGTNDVTVPFSNSPELFELVQSQEKIFKSFEGGHPICLNRFKMFDEMIKFILKHNGVTVDDQ